MSDSFKVHNDLNVNVTNVIQGWDVTKLSTSGTYGYRQYDITCSIAIPSNVVNPVIGQNVFPYVSGTFKAYAWITNGNGTANSGYTISTQIQGNNVVARATWKGSGAGTVNPGEGTRMYLDVYFITPPSA